MKQELAMSVRTVRCSFEEWVWETLKDIWDVLGDLRLVEYILDMFRNKPPKQPSDDTPEPVIARALPLSANATVSQPTLVVRGPAEGKTERKTK